MNAAASPNPSAKTDRQQIEEAIQGFIAAYNRGDAGSLLDCYAEDLIKDRQGAAAETREVTAARIAQGMRENTGHLEVDNTELVVSGDLAYARGTFRLTITPRAGGPPTSFSRRYLEIWRKREGRWVVTRTMDNTAP